MVVMRSSRLLAGGLQRTFRCVAGTSRGYQGGLTDKDRIFTNLYNDQSPYLEAAKKRVRQELWLSDDTRSLHEHFACTR